MKKSVKNPQKRYIFSKTGAKCPAALVLGRIVRYNTLNNYPYVPVWPAMRYAEVLLLAAEASLQSGNAGKAVDYVNRVRNRAQLPALGSVSMDDIKKEKRLELWMEGCRYQDLIRWGDAATVLAKRGQERPALYKDGRVSWNEQKNASAGFKSGKHELLPFPATEMNVNKNMTQNPGW